MGSLQSGVVIGSCENQIDELRVSQRSQRGWADEHSQKQATLAKFPRSDDW
jgi:hypothetical protein